MNKVIEEIELLSGLAQIINASVPEKYESAECRFIVEGGSVAEKFSYTQNGETIRSLLDDPNYKTMGLVLGLQKIMKVHTNGEWYECILSIDKKGKATTKFEYKK